MADASGADRGWILHAVSWPLFGICVLITATRFWVRARILRSCGWDDAFILLALICAAVNTVLVTLSIMHGTGRHMRDLSHEQQIASVKYQLLSQGFHVMSTNWGKVSVALFLVRIISEVKQHKRAMYAGMILLSIINIGGVYTIYGQCTPTAKAWDNDIKGTCWPAGAQRDYAFFQGSASAFSDLVLAVYPLLTIKDLQMATKVKFGLGFVLSLGIIAMVAAIIKTVHLAALSARTDYTWDTLTLTVWVAVEQYLIIIAACIPALTPLFNIIVRRVTSRRSKSKSTPNELGASDRKLSRPQPYLPFASVGREYVEYPMTCVGSAKDSKRRSSDSEALITIEPNSPTGILKTTEFHIQGLVRYDGL
ncbi:uncharacterized protein NFIA_073250 [Aspergillus fischeri NRRL 181]|uniref:Rhodopsin domain-containing protein n=1 Tax=Neosartorya fischeri (strain ATCC 1020 / DSM 3700 / CBS 544.65 / FGSC A1164 / JCM 1740 / NRRL 181 / WB 181) TaxID=331117 RepID=A1DDF3_NEOFI|nr:conserved hypothetical protein [Aspergillus fischeri NRRL 181]EAW17410.1 conserved hypothetical protein [Aspergillus fischeri NRRL 181]